MLTQHVVEVIRTGHYYLMPEHPNWIAKVVNADPACCQAHVVVLDFQTGKLHTPGGLSFCIFNPKPLSKTELGGYVASALMHLEISAGQADVNSDQIKDLKLAVEQF